MKKLKFCFTLLIRQLRIQHNTLWLYDVITVLLKAVLNNPASFPHTPFSVFVSRIFAWNYAYYRLANHKQQNSIKLQYSCRHQILCWSLTLTCPEQNQKHTTHNNTLEINLTKEFIKSSTVVSNILSNKSANS